MTSRWAAVARETVEIVERGGYVSPSGNRVEIGPAVAEAIAGTLLHLPEEHLAPAGPTATAVVEVVNESTLDAARRLGGDVAALNFASARNPGGGFLRGAKAQEESLARSSALYATLTSVPDFYAHHRADTDLRYSHRVICSPAVPVFRDDDGALLTDAYPVTFLTCAAPNTGAIARNQPEHLLTVGDTLRERAVRVLQVAAAHGHRRLVLGAWGCGVFGNDPAMVADAFAAALRHVDRFDHVTFAVLDRQDGTPTYEAFARVFTTG